MWGEIRRREVAAFVSLKKLAGTSENHRKTSIT